MKRFLKVLCSLIFVFMVGVGCGCNGCSSKAYPVEIKEWKLPKQEYQLGEYLDLTDSTIEVEYSNQEVISHEVTYDMVSIYDLLNVYGSIGRHSLTVTFEEKGYKVSKNIDIIVTIQKNRLEAINYIEELKQGTASIYSDDAQARIDALKVLARSAIYAAADDAEVESIKVKTENAINTVLTKAAEEAKENVATAIKEELLEKIGDAEEDLATLTTNVQNALAGAVSQEALDALKDAVETDYNGQIQELKDIINNGQGGVAREIELQVTAEYIQWKYSTEDTWTNLIALADLKGADGGAGAPGAAGENGKSVKLQVADNKIQWQLDGATTWTDLISLDALKGAPGAAGANGENGKNVELQLDATSNKIQWRLEGAATWTDLIDVAAITGAAGANGEDGEDGEDGVGIAGVELDAEGKLKFTFTDQTEEVIDLSGVFAPNAELLNRVTALETNLAKELDGDVAGSLQNQINTLAQNLQDLSDTVDGLNISDTFDALSDRIANIEAYFANSGITNADDIAAQSLVQMLTTLASEKVEELSLQYAGRVITLDELKEKMFDEVIPAAVLSYRAAKEAKVKAQEILDVLEDDSKNAKEQLQEVIAILSEYDTVLLSIGVPAEKVESLSLKINAFKDKLLNYVRAKLNSFIDEVAEQLQMMYDLDELLSYAAGNAELQARANEIRDLLTAINYTGDQQFLDAIADLHDLVDNVTIYNAFGTLGQGVQIAMNFMQIDSLNTILPALLASYIQEYYTKTIAPLADYLSAEEQATIEQAMNVYKYLILRTNSALNAIEYAALAEPAIVTSLGATGFGQIVADIQSAMANNDVDAAKNALVALDNAIVQSIMTGQYGAIILSQVEQQYIAVFTSRFSIIYFEQLKNDPTIYAQYYATEHYDQLFDDVISPLVMLEVNAIMADDGTITDIQNQCLAIVGPQVVALVDRLFAQYGYANIHATLGL